MKASTEAWNSKNTLKCKLSVCYTLCSSIKLENILSPGVLIEEPIHGERSWSGKELEQKQTGITCLQFEQSNRYIGSCQVEILKRCYHHVLKFPIVQIWQGGKWGLGFVACHWHPVTAQRFFGNRRCGRFLHHGKLTMFPCASKTKTLVPEHHEKRNCFNLYSPRSSWINLKLHYWTDWQQILVDFLLDDIMLISHLFIRKYWQNHC